MDEQVHVCPIISYNRQALKNAMTVKGIRLSELGEDRTSLTCECNSLGEKERKEGETRKERGESARDIKTQIASRQVTGCQKILDACCEETTIPICF